MDGAEQRKGAPEEKLGSMGGPEGADGVAEMEVRSLADDWASVALIGRLAIYVSIHLFP